MVVSFKGEKRNVWKLISLILAILLICGLVYYGITKYKSSKEKEKSELVKLGYAYAVSQIMEQASNCSSVSVYLENKTMNLVDVSCLQITKK